MATEPASPPCRPQEADFALGGFTVTLDRHKAIDFCFPFMGDSSGILIQKPGIKKDYFKAYMALHKNVWIGIVACILLAGVMFFLLSYLSPMSAWNLGYESAIIHEVSLKENCWAALGCFLMQGQDYYPFSHSARMALAFFMVFTICMMAAYNGDLVATLSRREPDMPFKTLEQMVKDTQYIPILTDGSSQHTFFKVTPVITAGGN